MNPQAAFSVVDLRAHRPEASDSQDEMRATFPDAEVTGYQLLVPAMPVNEDDRHGAAAGHAQVIVSLYLSDFPPVRPYISAPSEVVLAAATVKVDALASSLPADDAARPAPVPRVRQQVQLVADQF